MKTRNRDREESEEAYLRKRLDEIRQRKLREDVEEEDDDEDAENYESDDEAVGWELIPVLEQIEAVREQVIRLGRDFKELLRADPRLASLWDDFCRNGGTHSRELAAQLNGRQFRHRPKLQKKHLRIVSVRPNLNLRKIEEPTPIEHGHHDKKKKNRPQGRR